MFATDDTIVAIATPIGRAGLGVVRVSGPSALAVAGELIARRKPLAARRATLTTVRDVEAPASSAGRAFDQVVATYFPASGSYTGQDTVEISAHGNPVVLERIVAAAVRAGARMARPGEFTLRAYVSGRMDLVQAEAVADLIEAVTPTQVRQAFDQLSGTLTAAIAAIASQLDGLVTRLEASLDFPEEGYHFARAEEIRDTLITARGEIQALLEGARRGRVIREGREVALVGGPNVGKSSLFNALVGAERAIVTEIPGTTRDLVTEQCDVGGSPVTLVDTAGLREGAERVEQEGIRRTRGAAASAALAVVVLDRSRPLGETEHALAETTSAAARVIVGNKCDLPPMWDLAAVDANVVGVSARTGEGLSELRHAIDRALTGSGETSELPRISNVRHIGLLETAASCLDRAMEQARHAAPEELVLVDLHEARHALDEVVGRRTPDDVLASIFSEFCIGK